MTTIKDLLAAMKERETMRDRRLQVQVEIDAISDRIGLNPARRRDNLRLLRGLFSEHQDEFASMLEICSQSTYSRLESGKSELDDNQARKVEFTLNLPLGWLDRDNGAAIQISNEEFELIQELKKSAPDGTASLIQAVKNIRLSRVASV